LAAGSPRLRTLDGLASRIEVPARALRTFADFPPRAQYTIANSWFGAVAMTGVAGASFGDAAASRDLLLPFIANGILLSLFNGLAAARLGTLDRFGFRVVVWPVYGYAAAALITLVSTLAAS
jgi:hypothetical protein